MSYLYKFNSDNFAININKMLPDTFVEKDIENIIELNPHLIFYENLLIIGRQVKTDTGKIIDLLAVDSEGRIILIELKRGNAPRDVIAQVIDYASWLNEISERELEEIASTYFNNYNKPCNSLFETMKHYYNNPNIILDKSEVKIIIFAHDFPIEVSRTANFLSERGIYLYCIAFELFNKDNDRYILIREISSPRDDSKKYNQSKSHIQELTTSQNDRALFIKLKEFLENNSEILFSSKYTISDKLSIYQPIDGHRIACKISWQYGSGKLEFRFDYFREENEFSITIQTRRKSDLFTEHFNSDSFKSIINKHLIIDYDKGNPFIYYNFPTSIEFDDNLIIDAINIYKEMFLPLLEYLLLT